MWKSGSIPPSESGDMDLQGRMPQFYRSPMSSTGNNGITSSAAGTPTGTFSSETFQQKNRRKFLRLKFFLKFFLVLKRKEGKKFIIYFAFLTSSLTIHGEMKYMPVFLVQVVATGLAAEAFWMNYRNW
jgi:hypothetical protein